MTEIWNLSTLCRCCHSDGTFKKLNTTYTSDENIVTYEMILYQTLAIKIYQPSLTEVSDTICDTCMQRLTDAYTFRQQVLACENDFIMYCNNEQDLNNDVEDIKTEVISNDELNKDEECQEIKTEAEFALPLQNEGESSNSNDDDNIQSINQSTSLSQSTAAHGPLPIYATELGPAPSAYDSIMTTEIDEEEDMKTMELAEQGKKTRRLKIDISKAVRNTKCIKLRRDMNYKKFLVVIQCKDKQTFSCNVCGGSYTYKKDIYAHINLKHTNNLKCLKCNKHFEHSSHLQSHYKLCKHITQTNFICRHCGKTFSSKYNLKEHENTHGKETILYQCDICEKVLKYKNTLKKHILQIHTSQIELLCDICGWPFKEKSNLKAHIRTVHFKQRPYSCQICGKTYTANKHVKAHIKSAHSDDPKPHHCTLCTKQFACPKSLKLHKLTHDSQFACKRCTLVFDSKKDRDNHTKTHTEHFLNSPFTCQLCSKVLRTKHSLNRHLEMHNGIKRFSCDICGMKFSQKALVKRHMRRKHDPNTNYDKTKCSICKRNVINMRKHMESHEADKRRYVCDVCGNAYTENNALTRHKNQKHYGVAHNCDVCGKKYMKRKSLETHKFKVHKVKAEVDSGSNEGLELG